MDTRLLETLNYSAVTATHVQDFGRLRDNHKKNLSVLTNYIRTSSLYATSQGILHQFLQMIDVVRKNKIDYAYWDTLCDESRNLYNSLGLTSELSPGKVLRGTVYPESIKEIVVCVNSELPTKLDNWTSWKPIRVVNHTMTDLQLRHFDLPTDESGYAVMTVDLPLLKLQHEMWLETENKKEEQYRENTSSFLMKYPFANTLPDHLDIAILNRVAITMDEELEATVIRPRGITILQLERDTDDIYGRIIKTLLSTSRGLHDVVSSLPLISHDTVMPTMDKMSDLVVTRQILWAKIFADVEKLCLITKLGSYAGATSTEFRSRFERFYRSIRSDRSLDECPDKAFGVIISGKLEEIANNIL